jgi:hypothetical protein
MKKLDKFIGFLDRLEIEESEEKEEIIKKIWGEKTVLQGTFDTIFHHAKAALPHKTFCGKYNKSVIRLE